MQTNSDPFQRSNIKATQELQKDPKYASFLVWCKEQGMCLEKINFPTVFGPQGYLVGIATNQKIQTGEWFFKIPCSTRTDFQTIRESPYIGQILKALDINEDLTLSLYIMHQLLIGTQSRIYHPLSVFTPADTPFLWSNEEINLIGDKQTVNLINKMKDQTLQDAQEIYNKVLEFGILDKFCIGEQSRENFIQQYLLAWQYSQTRYVQYEFYLKFHTVAHLIESMNHTPGRYSLHQLVDSNGNVLASNKIGITNLYCIPGFESINGQYVAPNLDELNEIISEVPIEINNEQIHSMVPPEGSYFQMVSLYDLEEGEQIPYNYGHVTNRSLLINYGFIIQNNESDCFSIILQIQGRQKHIILHRNNKSDKFLAACAEVLKDSGLIKYSNDLVCQFGIDLIYQQYYLDFEKQLDDVEEISEEQLSSRKNMALEFKQYQKIIYQYHVNEIRKLMTLNQISQSR
ncbi:UNKNOWN [Stylonychia lemnae]|uniref:SET domain-containing protein n=1 Tax=Stylonychia lemnae TaxID=5949 RepID=A0A078B1J5_STYLE|nr:UNKNOWN [Stylonychia lemnae]|eukprot:CDW87207.1 UNKNOWN [Stylonychia lemnae]